MKFHVMTLFPEMVEHGLNTSILGRARQKNIIAFDVVDIRDYTLDKHRRVDDYPYGGGAGMVMAAEPVVRCYRAIVIYLTPQGQTFHQELAKEFAAEEELVFLCGHYEGIDERAIETIVTDQVSIGDYVLTGGELPAMVMIDVIARLVPGVLNNGESPEVETFHDNLLEYPQYTRPEIFEGKKVPEVLLSGHHAKIEEWRRRQSIIRTDAVRPDLIEQANLTKKEWEFYKNYKESQS